MFVFSLVKGTRGQSSGIAVENKCGPVKIGYKKKKECVMCINMRRGRRSCWKLYTSRNINIS